MPDLLLIEAFLRTARMVAVVAGVIVFLDQFRTQDVPPHNKRLNALGWAAVATGAVIGGTMTLWDAYGISEPIADVTVARAFVWAGLATGLTMRSAMRAKRGFLVWIAAGLLGATGFIASVADAWL